MAARRAKTDSVCIVYTVVCGHRHRHRVGIGYVNVGNPAQGIRSQPSQVHPCPLMGRIMIPLSRYRGARACVGGALWVRCGMEREGSPR